ncbi:hypothetical protein C8J35_1536 [Rhizobium sp. PP-F2F-G38]|nr:hypothetical protein C8J35_1536 [Rhizobium sp. PP-F2F-G38]
MIAILNLNVSFWADSFEKLVVVVADIMLLFLRYTEGMICHHSASMIGIAPAFCSQTER